MALFLIMAEDQTTPKDLHKLIQDAYPDVFRINKQCWIISVQGLTAVKIATNLGVEPDDDEKGTRGIVVFRATPSYWGNASTELWDWVAAKVESTDG